MWWIRRRVIVYCLLRLAAVDLALVARREVWRAYDPDDYVERLKGCRLRPCDVVVVRGSAAKEGIDPSALVGLSLHARPLGQAYDLAEKSGTTTEVWHAVGRAPACGTDHEVLDI